MRILATSREGLDVAGETIYLVPSLEVPDAWQVLPLEELLGYAAVRLFVERARARRVDFALSPRNAAAVVQICHRLDGIPLAIELAAARIDTLPVEGIAARLDDCFRLLTGGPRTALPRQKTLRATLDWSYGLLSSQEQLLLPRLSVFAGGWTLDAAEAICGGDGVEVLAVVDLLAGLVRKSLVSTGGTSGSTCPYCRTVSAAGYHAAVWAGEAGSGWQNRGATGSAPWLVPVVGGGSGAGAYGIGAGGVAGWAGERA